MQTLTKGRPCEDTGCRRPSASQGERPQWKPTLPTPGSPISSLQDRERRDVCCLSTPPSLQALLGQPQQTKADALYQLWGRDMPGQGMAAQPWDTPRHPDQQSWGPSAGLGEG